MEDTIMSLGAIAVRLKALAQDAQLCILIVDDDELERALIGDWLEAHDFEVAQAANGVEALALLERKSFPVLLVDWQMPVMDGIELTESLRARGMTETYVIMLTARESSFDYERGYQAGVDDYLTKKVRDPELFARIHAGFSTFALRRDLKEARAALAAAGVHRPKAT